MAIYRRIGTNGKAVHWRVVIAIPDATGKRRSRVVGAFRTRRDAQAAERDAMQNQDRGTPFKRDKITVTEVLEWWLEVDLPRTARPENRQAYEIVIRKHLVPALGTRQVQQLNVEDVECFYAAMQEKGHSANTIKKCHMCPSSVLRMAKRWKLVRESVCDDVKPPKPSCTPRSGLRMRWTASSTSPCGT